MVAVKNPSRCKSPHPAFKLKNHWTAFAEQHPTPCRRLPPSAFLVSASRLPVRGETVRPGSHVVKVAEMRVGEAGIRVLASCGVDHGAVTADAGVEPVAGSQPVSSLRHTNCNFCFVFLLIVYCAPLLFTGYLKLQIF